MHTPLSPTCKTWSHLQLRLHPCAAIHRVFFGAPGCPAISMLPRSGNRFSALNKSHILVTAPSRGSQWSRSLRRPVRLMRGLWLVKILDEGRKPVRKCRCKIRRTKTTAERRRLTRILWGLNLRGERLLQWSVFSFKPEGDCFGFSTGAYA